MDARGSAARRRGRPPSSSHSPPPSRRRGLRVVPPRPPRGRAPSDGVCLRRGRPPGRGHSRGCPRSILPPNSDLLPMPAASPPLFSVVPTAAVVDVVAASSSTPQSAISHLVDLTEAEIQRKRQIWMGKRPVIDSSSGTAAFCSLLLLLGGVVSLFSLSLLLLLL